MTDAEKKRFCAVCDNIIDELRVENGVGTLQEKTIHAVLKNYYEPDMTKQEQKVEGFVADIFTGEEIIEIQTKGFFRLRRKLERFLPNYPVTVVYPVIHRKWLRWVNEETGEVSAARKSPKTGNGHSVFSELYGIKMLMPDANLTVQVVLLDVEEFRMLNGWSKDKKKGSTRSDGIPKELIDVITLHSKEDYRRMIPDNLPAEFTTADYKAAVRCSKALAGVELNILAYLGVLEKVGKKGNSILYHILIS